MWRATILILLFASLFSGDTRVKASERLLILPFDNATGSPEFDEFATGAADLLPVCLSNQTTELAVIDRGALEALLTEKELELEGLLERADGTDSLAILGADVIVRGSISRDGSELAVNVFLHDVETTQLIASSSHQRPADRAFELLCNDAAAEIARRLTGDLVASASLPADADPIRTQLLLSGVGHYHNGDYAQAFPAFMKLLKRDSSDAEAQFWLAQSFYSAGMAKFAAHELQRFIARFPADRNLGRAQEILHEIQSNGEN